MAKLLLVLSLLLAGALCDLPTDLKVNSYDLSLIIASNLAVEGTVTISLTCQTTTPTIVLHWGSSLTPTNPSTSDLTITYTDTSSTPPTSPVTFTTTAVDGLNKLTITSTTPTTFPVGSTIVVVAKFKYTVSSDSKGLFYREYTSVNNQKNKVLLTNLRPTFARELFPCLDEPQLSAALTLTLTYPNSWGLATTAKPTSPPSSTTTGTTTVIFNSVTLPPNTFALFLAENMNQVSYSKDSKATKLYFWSRQPSTSSVLNANVQYLSQYYYVVEDLLGITIPLGQLTIVMVPELEEPLAGYGVIFIREDNYAQDYSSPQLEGLYKTNVAPVVYQFLRQFTEFSTRPKSWSDYWVSQAIARYLQYTILNTVMPILDFKTDLEVVARQTSLFLDSLPGSKPLQETSVITDSSASVQSLINDPLKSLKGAFILNMLDQSLPAGTVFATIINFLAANKETEISSNEFYTVIRSIANNPSISIDAGSALMSNSFIFWFNSSSYPMEAVKLSKTGTPGSVTFTTTAFCSVLNASCTANLPGTFYVPATVSTKTENRYYTPRQDFWASNKDVSTSNDIDVADGDWVVANMKSGGYYRSSYDTDNWERIITALSTGDIRLLGRTQLLDDAFALAMSSTGALSYNITVRLSLANLGNTLYRDWVPVQRGLHNIRDSLLGLDIYSSYKNFAAGYFLNLNGFLQNKTVDSFEKARIQALFLDDFCEYDITGYRAFAMRNLTNLLSGMLPTTVPSSAYDAVACCGSKYNSSLKANMLWNILSDTTLSYYRRHFASVALGCLSNYTDIAQTYNSMTTTGNLLKPYVVTAMQGVADNHPVSFLADFAPLASKFQSQLGAATVASLIQRAGFKVNNITQAAALVSSLVNNANVDTLVQSTAQNTAYTVNNKVNWLSSNNKSLVLALETHTFPSGTSNANMLAIISLLVFLPSLLVV